MCHLLNFQKNILMIRPVTNKIIINLKRRKCNNLFKPLTKRNINIYKIHYCNHNKNEIKVSHKIKMKPKKTS